MTETTATNAAAQDRAIEPSSRHGSAHEDMTEIVASALAAGRHITHCGCGFFAISYSQIENRYALEEHPCPLNPVVGGGGAGAAESRPWYGYVFSMWGALIAGIIMYGLIVILTGGKVT